MVMRAMMDRDLALEYRRALAAWTRDQHDTDAIDDLVFAENEIAYRLGVACDEPVHQGLTSAVEEAVEEWVGTQLQTAPIRG
jgi:hypothetical protein